MQKKSRLQGQSLSVLPWRKSRIIFSMIIFNFSDEYLHIFLWGGIFSAAAWSINMTMRNLIAASNSLWYHDFPRKKKTFCNICHKIFTQCRWIGQAIQSRETLQAIAAKADEFYKGHEDQRKKAIRGNLQIQLFYPLVTHLLKSSMHYAFFAPF